MAAGDDAASIDVASLKSLSAVRKLRVAELRALLEARDLDTTGLKSALVDRLWGALEEGGSEEEEEEVREDGSEDGAPAADDGAADDGVVDEGASAHQQSPQPSSSSNDDVLMEPASASGGIVWETPAQIEARLAQLGQRRRVVETVNPGTRVQSSAEIAKKKAGPEPSLTGGAITASKRRWKTQPGQKRERMQSNASRVGVSKTWKRKEQVRRETQRARDFARELREEQEAERASETAKRKERERRREANAKRSTVTQIITNPNTIKRMTKKQLRNVHRT